MEKAEAEPFLRGLGFDLNSSTRLGDSYSRPLDTGMKVSAYASFVGNLFNLSDHEYDEVVFTLESKGTSYKFRSLDSLRLHATEVLNTLHTVSKTPDLLKCPKCGIRYVHAKEPVAGQKWKPFLSCEGMVIERRGKTKGIVCDGTSTKLPAVVVYP